MNISEYNTSMLDKRLQLGFSLLQSAYEIKEEEKMDFTIRGMHFFVTRYDVKDVGNLLLMKCPGAELSEEAKVAVNSSGSIQMDSFVLTPYYKNLPLFSTDYIYNDERRSYLNEIYDLVAEQDDVYLSFIRRFRAISNDYAALADMPQRPCWYDSMRSVCTAKITDRSSDDDNLKLFERNLRLWIEMEQQLTPLTGDALKEKKRITRDYAARLVSEGGVSTDVFKAELGPEKTTKFFLETFFAPDRY